MVSKIITKKCEGCGEEKTANISYFRRLSNVKNNNKYYCYKCKPKAENRGGFVKGHKFLGGGFKKGHAFFGGNTGRKKNFAPNSKIEITCNDCGKTRFVYKSYLNNLKNIQQYGIYRCRRCNLKYIRKTGEFEPKRLIKIKESLNTDEWKEKNLLAMRKISKDPIVRERHKKSMRDIVQTNDWKLKNKESRLISTIGQGFWYGNSFINNYNRAIYCELWEDVKPRIYAFNIDMHDGILTCEVCENPIVNGKHKFIHHHVFYEKQACCWNNDGIYTTNLNIKTIPKDSYIIGEDPNYFAITCIKCHGKTNGGFENRKKWADFFKNKIDTKYNGKSYYTKEEMIEREMNIGNLN